MSPPPSAPASPLDLPSDGLDDAQLGGESDQQAQPLRVGIRLSSARLLTFGLDSAQENHGAQLQVARRPPSPSRKSKRTKLEMAEAKIAELREELAEQRKAGRGARQPAACAHCDIVKQGYEHQELLHRRQYNYLKRQLTESKQEAREAEAAHQEATETAKKAHEKERDIAAAKFQRKFDALEHKLDMAKIENNNMAKNKFKELSTSSSIAAREAAKESTLHEKLKGEVAHDKAKLQELRARVEELERTLAEVDAEMEVDERSSGDRSESDAEEDNDGDDHGDDHDGTQDDGEEGSAAGQV